MWRELMVALVAADKPLIAERALLFVYYWSLPSPSLSLSLVWMHHSPFLCDSTDCALSLGDAFVHVILVNTCLGF